MSPPVFSDLAQAIGRRSVLAVAGPLLLAACSRHRAGTGRRVAFVGTAAPEEDAPFVRYRAALDKLPAATRGRLDLIHVRVRDEGAEAAQRDLQRRPGPEPDLWVTPTGDSALAVRRLAPTRPQVFAVYPDPVLLGLVEHLHAPGRPATGIALGDQLHAKRLELLLDAFPQVRSVAVLLDTSWQPGVDPQQALIQPARALGLQADIRYADTPADVDRLMGSPAAAAVDAWYIPGTYIAYRADAAIIAHLQRLQRPAIHASTAEVAQGALMAYAQDRSFVFDALAELTARVAAGEDAARIPVMRPMRFELSVRPRAQPAALRIQPSVVRRADRVF